MNMTVRHAVEGVARKTRHVKILDLVGLRVEQVENIELQPQSVVEFVAGTAVEDQRFLRTHVVVLDQRTWAEIARAQGAEPAGVAAERHAAARDDGRRTGNAIAGRIAISEAGMGVGEITLERNPCENL